MAYSKVDFSGKVVTNSMCLRPGGTIGVCTYTRRPFNLIRSGRLLERMAESAKSMVEGCKTSEHCVPEGDPRVGKIAPDGLPYKVCDVETRKRKILAARECAIRQLSR